MSTKRIALVVLVGVAVIGGGIALWNAGGGSADTAASTKIQNLPAGALAATGTDAQAAKITANIYRISKIQLDTSLFQDPAYLSLVDRSQAIPVEPVGRPDPFAPLYQDDVSKGTTGRDQGQGGLLNQKGTAVPVKATQVRVSTSTPPKAPPAR